MATAKPEYKARRPLPSATLRNLPFATMNRRAEEKTGEIWIPTTDFSSNSDITFDAGPIEHTNSHNSPLKRKRGAESSGKRPMTRSNSIKRKLEESNTRRTLTNVYSKDMIAASSAFAAMFGPHFAEGQGLSLKLTSTKIIRLPDDDGFAFKNLCAVIYGQNVAMPTIEELESVASLNDKYMTSEAIRAWSSQQLNEWSGRVDGTQSWLKMLRLAWQFDDQDMFYKASKKVPWVYSSNFLKAFEDEILPKKLLGRTFPC
jgi:hypothetical protein